MFNCIFSLIQIHYADSRVFILKTMFNEILTNARKRNCWMCEVHKEIAIACSEISFTNAIIQI